MTSDRAPTVSPVLDLLRRAGSHPAFRSFPHGAIVVFDHDLRYLALGGTGLADVGLSREVLEGHTIHEVFPADVVEIIEPLYRAALRGEKSATDVLYEGRIFLQQLGPLYDDDGGPVVAAMGFTYDVTAERRAQHGLEASDERLREEHRRLEKAQEVGRVGSWEWDIGTATLTCSDAMLRLYGLDPAAAHLDYAATADRVHPDDRAVVDAALRDCLATGTGFGIRYRVLRADDGDLRWFDARSEVLCHGDVQLRVTGVVADVTEQVRAEQEAHEAQSFANAVLAASPDLMMVTDLDLGRVVYASGDQGMLGLSTDQLLSLQAAERLAFVHPEDLARLQAVDAEARGLQDAEVLQLLYRGRHTDGTWRWLNRRITPFHRDVSGRVVQVLGVTRDVTDVVHAEERLTHAALHDPLTGLPNRALLMDRLDAALVRATREGREVAVLFCDLDGFKSVNDTHGHAAGDAVLVEVAQRLRGAVREGDTVARIGGDEFVLVVEPWNRATAAGPDGTPVFVGDREVALRVADRVAKALRLPFLDGEAQHFVTASIGVAYTTRAGADGITAGQVLHDADAAMYRAKSLGKDRTAVSQLGAWPSDTDLD